MELTAIAQWLNTAFAGYDYAILQALRNLAGAAGHVTAAMAGVTALVLAGKKPARWWAYLFVLAMGAARNYLMAHYPSDVLGGMIVGLIAATVAYAVTLLIYRIVSAHPDNRFCRFVLHGGIGSKKERQAA